MSLLHLLPCRTPTWLNQPIHHACMHAYTHEQSRLLWFFAMSAVETHTACQKQGIVYANYSAQSNLASTDRERYWEICKVFNAVPVRFEAMYFGYHHDNMKSLSDLMEYGLMDSSRHGMNVMIGTYQLHSTPAVTVYSALLCLVLCPGWTCARDVKAAIAMSLDSVIASTVVVQLYPRPVTQLLSLT
mmetsp:Transcript_14127/g.38908  ORF Transcript_14127/g.38908 Transcript_14127/m.38908 type:complete len:187 (-) Transcript_14127:847-1407(-)